MDVSDDLSAWHIWWEFNKDPYIKLRDSIHANRAPDDDAFFMGSGGDRAHVSLRPTQATVRDVVLPNLAHVLRTSRQRDIVSSCLIALAKTGQSTPEVDTLELIRAELTSADLEIRQTAALALGITQMPAAIDDLLALSLDREAGRTLCMRSSVDGATRAFATYGCGLLAWATPDHDLKHRVLDEFASALRAGSIRDRNILVAMINAIGLLAPDTNSRGIELVRKAYKLLIGEYWSAERGPAGQLIQSHAPTAMAKLLSACPDRATADAFRQRLLDRVRDRQRLDRARAQYAQSVILALGRVAKPEDRDVSRALLDYYREGDEKQARFFCLIALGQIGGPNNREHLMDVLKSGSKALHKPWAAISLGVLCYERLARDPDDLDEEVGRALRGWIAKIKNPESLAALAIGLGLAGHRDAADDIRALLAKHEKQDTLAGYLCIGLALMNDRASIDAITEVVQSSSRRPERLRQAAVALGRLGDAGVIATLTDQLAAGPTNLSRMSALAAALGLIGDARSVQPLVDLMRDETMTDLARAFAVVALGGVADKEPLPWNSKIARDLNYRAAVETLTNQASGILDIL